MAHETSLGTNAFMSSPVCACAFPLDHCLSRLEACLCLRCYVCRYFPLSVTHAGTTVSCPPACPGSSADSGVIGGAYYMYLCDSYLTGLQCLDIEAAKYCALGAGTKCSPCPEGGFCPGGFRLWYDCNLHARVP
jgi:hypothetical protein